jgi:hypothetical protein
MSHPDGVTLLQRAAGRRADDGARDIALGLLLFSMSVGLDLGRVPLFSVVLVALIVPAIQFHLIWPRGGYSREPGRFVAEMLLLFGLSFLALLAVAASVGVSGATGFPSGAARSDLSRLASMAAILALPGLLALIGVRRHVPRYFAYAVAIPAAFATGPFLGLEMRAWSLALLALAVVGIGVLRLRRFLAENPVIPGVADEEA